MPKELMELMRHKSIDTTMRFYVGQNADKTASILWEAYQGLEGVNGRPTVRRQLPSDRIEQSI